MFPEKLWLPRAYSPGSVRRTFAGYCQYSRLKYFLFYSYLKLMLLCFWANQLVTYNDYNYRKIP